MRRTPGNPLSLGNLPDGRTLNLPSDARDKHLYVVGGTGTGKSKFLENLIRQDIKNWRKSKCGLLLLDPHGSLYDSLMGWLAWSGLDVPIIPIDLRRDDWVVAYNVLRQRPVADPAVVVNNFVQAMAYVWGQADTTQTPLFARWASNILRALYEKKLTLVEAEHLTDRLAKQSRQLLTDRLGSPAVARDWNYAQTLTPKDFEAQISSTLNRLHAFLSTRAMRQMFGQPGPSLDLGTALQEGHIILVSLATERERVSEEDANLFATLLLSDLWTAAKERGKGKNGVPPKPFYVYCDEFQNFVIPTIANNLDQARGFGLHLTLAHQFPNQLLHTGPHGKQVYDSIMVNARSKVVFSVEGEENLRPLAQALFSGVMSPDKIKHTLYATKVMNYREEERKTYARSEGRGTSSGSQRGRAGGQGFGETYLDPDGNPVSPASASWSEFGSESESEQHSTSESVVESESTSTVLVPEMGKELASVQFEPLEEQLFRSMALLVEQQQRHCLARLVDQKAPVSISVPLVPTTPASQERIERYFQSQIQRWPFALKTLDAQKRLEERETTITPELLRQASAEEPATARRKVA